MRGCLWVLLLLLGAVPAWAHPGRTDACRGHTVSERVVYGDASTLWRNLSDSEPGEYHYHVSPEQADAVMTQTRRAPVGSVITVDGVEYEVLPRTRQHEVLLRCETPQGLQPAGVVRVRRP